MDKAGFVQLTEEEKEAIGENWKMFSDMAKADAPEGTELYVPKEIAGTLERMFASEALLGLAEEYLMMSNSTSYNEVSDEEKSILFKKAGNTAKNAVMVDPDPLTFYKAGNIFYKINEIEPAKMLYGAFLESAPNLLLRDDEKYKFVIQTALDDIKSKNIL